LQHTNNHLNQNHLNPDAQQIIDLLQLEPLHFEGGYFRRTYSSNLRICSKVLPEAYKDERPIASAIYYFLTPETFSSLHSLPTDEMFHFYAGDPVEMLLLHPDGLGEIIRLGNNLFDGQKPQFVVPAGTWQGCRLEKGGRYALMGATVSPGFEDIDFNTPNQSELQKKFPEFTNWINELTR
jgi:predicted cupin superfamily sugar epimerase